MSIMQWDRHPPDQCVGSSKKIPQIICVPTLTIYLCYDIHYLMCHITLYLILYLCVKHLLLPLTKLRRIIKFS